MNTISLIKICVLLLNKSDLEYQFYEVTILISFEL